MPYAGEKYTSTCTITDEDILTDPDEITVSLIDPTGNIIFENAQPIRDSTGTYHYDYFFNENTVLGSYVFAWTITVDDETTTINDSVLVKSNTDLCTVAQVKLESLGRITDNSLDAEIQSKITQLSKRIRIKACNQDIPCEPGDNANMACIYGILAWLTLNKKIKEHKRISSFKDVNLSVNFTNNNTKEDNKSDDCKIYEKLIAQIIPGAYLGDA